MIVFTRQTILRVASRGSWSHRRQLTSKTPAMSARADRTSALELRIAGREESEPNDRGVPPELMTRAGFAAVEETARIGTSSGAITLSRGHKNSGEPR